MSEPGFYGWQRPPTVAEYLNERKFEEAVERHTKATNPRLLRSQAWMDKYRAAGRGRTAFNWGTITSPITTENDHDETTEAAQERVREGLGDAAGAHSDQGEPSEAGGV